MQHLWEAGRAEPKNHKHRILIGLMGVALNRNKMQWARILVLATSRVVPALPFFLKKNSRQKRGGNYLGRLIKNYQWRAGVIWESEY